MMDNRKLLCDLTKTFWHYYLLEPTEENFDEIFTYFSDELVLIGTGKHEFYLDLSQAAENISDNRIEAEQINFQIIDEWYQCNKITDDVYTVFGGFWVRQSDSAESDIRIEMDTRFTMVYRKNGDKWQIMNVHHSIPYSEQLQGEHYPKTLSDAAREAITKAEIFEKKSELDLMTDIYNNESFKKYTRQKMKDCDKADLYLFDLDHFKQINDTYGHMIGDETLKLFAILLQKHFSADSILGRMGGDEFAVFSYKPQDRETAIAKIKSMQREFEVTAKQLLNRSVASCSVGVVTQKGKEHPYDVLYANADNALYAAKNNGRRTYYWFDEQR